MAKRLLAEAGYPNGFEVELWVPESGSGMQAPVEMSTVIQANLAAVGVKAALKTMEWGSYLGKLCSDAPPMFALSWFLSPTGRTTPTPRSTCSSSRPAADRGKQAELYRRVQRIVVEDAPWIFVDHEIQVVATRAGLKGFKLHPSGFELRVEHVE